MNIMTMIANRDGRRFLELLDAGFKKAARQASDESHALGLTVADGREPSKTRRAT